MEEKLNIGINNQQSSTTGRPDRNPYQQHPVSRVKHGQGDHTKRLISAGGNHHLPIAATMSAREGENKF